MRIAAGVLMIFGGLGAVVGASMAVGAMFVFGGLSIIVVAILTALVLALMTMCFIGAYCAFTRRRFKLALAGAICAAITIPFVPGLLATIFLALRKREFQQVAEDGSAGARPDVSTRPGSRI